jgi:hypothetical protein
VHASIYHLTGRLIAGSWQSVKDARVLSVQTYDARVSWMSITMKLGIAVAMTIKIFYIYSQRDRFQVRPRTLGNIFITGKVPE